MDDEKKEEIQNSEAEKGNKKIIIPIILSIVLIAIAATVIFVSAKKKQKPVTQAITEVVPNKTTDTATEVVCLSEDKVSALNKYLNQAENDVSDSTSNLQKKKPRGIDPSDNLGSDDGSGKGANTSKSDIDNADKCIAILFDYGSYSENGNIFIRKFFGGENLPVNEENCQTVEITKVLNDFINEIPKEKRSSAKFKIYGYSDTSFRNGIPDEGEESRIFNEKLSYNRAEFIKDVLIHVFNVSPINIFVEGRGFVNPWRNKDPETGKAIYNPEKSRRVEVFCYYEKN